MLLYRDLEVAISSYGNRLFARMRITVHTFDPSQEPIV
uniref:Uncharacterized protein n=1 Tax=Rhizophora mucronata TaxID=61149 RepID=A0A2P2NWF0_RHIMU